MPINLSQMEANSEGQDKEELDNDWPIYVESGDDDDDDDNDANEDDSDDKPEIHQSGSDRETLI